MKKSVKSYFAVLCVMVSVMIFFSCEKEKNDPVIPDDGYTHGFYIVNEGLFQTGSGTIDFVSNNGTVYEDIFAAANNGLPLGNIVQSVGIIGDQTYIIVNNANKIEVVKTQTFLSAATIENLSSPRYIIPFGEDKALVSCIGDNSVKIINLDGFGIMTSLPVNGPEKMLQVDNQIWVLRQGGWSVDSVITVIDITTQAIVGTIQVYPQPSGICEDMNGRIWVMCSGRNSWHPGGNSAGHLVCINPADHTLLNDIEFPSAEEHPEELVINSTGDVLYFRYPGGIYKFEIVAVQPESEAFIFRASGFYTIAFDTQNSLILGSDPVDYISDGWIYRYHADSGSLADSIKAGIAPGEIYFVP